MSHILKLQKKELENILFVLIDEKRFDSTKVISFKTEFEKLIDSGKNKIVIDMSMVDYLDSSGLGALITIYKKLGQTGSLVFLNVTVSVMSLMKITQMDKLFRVVDSEDEAVAIING